MWYNGSLEADVAGGTKASHERERENGKRKKPETPGIISSPAQGSGGHVEASSTSILDFLVPIFLMTTLMQFSIKFSIFKPSFFHGDIFKKPTFAFSPLDSKLELASLHQGSFKLRACGERWSFLGGGGFRNGVLLQEKRFKRKKRVVLVKNNLGFGFNGVSGGGGRDNGESARIFGNLALAIGLTYLSMTGQLGWILDVVVSIWIFAVLIPIVGLGAFLWCAGRDIMQGTCPNCGNEFQVFRSSLNDDLQLCPFCGLPFSVVGNEFVKDSVKFSNQSTTFGQALNNFSRSRNEKDYVRAIDVEAEIKDAD